MKLYGTIDVEKLLSAAPKPYAFDIEKVRAAVEVPQVQREPCSLITLVEHSSNLDIFVHLYKFYSPRIHPRKQFVKLMELISTRRAAGVNDFDEMHKEVEIISQPEKALSMSGNLWMFASFSISLCIRLVDTTRLLKHTNRD